MATDVIENKKKFLTMPTIFIANIDNTKYQFLQNPIFDIL